MPKVKCCKVCQGQSDLYLCQRCTNEIRELLVGKRIHEDRSQPGICWYIGRLTEQAYGQSKLGISNGAKSSREGYALLVDKRAIELLDRIRATLWHWQTQLATDKAHRDRDSGAPASTLSDFQPSVGITTPALARWVANRHMKALRRHPNSYQLHAALLSYAKQAWRIINRPPDMCCGPCPTMLAPLRGEKDAKPCGTLLYAEERESRVKCPRCRMRHDVEQLRDALRHTVTDMLFTGPELLRLMETRLNDRLPKPTFYKYVKDGRLQPRSIANDGVKFYTYNDVCEAREKPAPTRQSKAS